MAEFGSSEAGKKGGKARAKNLSSEQRSEIARDAALSRWEREGKTAPPLATHDGVIQIGLGIPAYVLEDGTRLVSTRGVMKALGRRWRGRKYPGTQLPVFLEAANLKPFIDNDLTSVLSVVEFRTGAGFRGEGFKAEIVPMVCETYLRAREADPCPLVGKQFEVAQQCEILMRGLANVGIIALVDEATGYERDKERNDLARILKAFVAKELQKWLPTFDLEFYELMCDIRQEPLQRAKARPAYMGTLTNNLVYERLAPGVLQKLREVNPVVDGRRKHKHHQHLTPDLGHPKLKEHLAGVMAVMKVAKMQTLPWDDFLKVLDKTHPPYKHHPLFEHLDDDR